MAYDRALEKNELFLMYQTDVDLSTGHITGCEALLRWRHPKLGLVPPDKFIPVAECTGLIVPIGEWVLRSACNQAKQWQNAALPSLPVSVNVSPVQFRQKDFAQLVRTVRSETGLAPKHLELELTEGLIISSAQLLRSVLRKLTEMGVRLSIDDFGTGYSNLSYLRQFPVYKLIIDRSFVKDIAVGTDDAAITGAIIHTAQSLNLRVTRGRGNRGANVVPAGPSLRRVSRILFSKPLLPKDFADTLRRATADAVI